MIMFCGGQYKNPMSSSRGLWGEIIIFLSMSLLGDYRETKFLSQKLLHKYEVSEIEQLEEENLTKFKRLYPALSQDGSDNSLCFYPKCWKAAKNLQGYL